MFTPLKDLPEGRNWTLDELNDREVQLLIPITIFISIIMVVGTVGNAFVLYVNIFVFKLGSSTHRYCIIFLAFTDITFCMISDPFVIALFTHPYTFTNTLACKSLRALAYFNALVSAMILTVIALDRYRMICRPYGNQFSIRRMQTIFGIIAFLSFIFSIPCFILNGNNTVQTGIANITGIQCYDDDMYKDTLIPSCYNMFVFLFFIILAVSISLFYTLVWRQIRKHKQSIKTNTLPNATEPNVSPCMTETNSTEMVSASTITQHKICHDPINVDDPGKYINEGNKRNKYKKTTDRAKTIRVSKMLFVVTVFFLLSFAPFLSLQLLTFFDEQFIENLDNTSTVFYQLFTIMFAINFMVNPFIYGVMDRKFRMECKKIVLKRLRI